MRLRLRVNGKVGKGLGQDSADGRGGNSTAVIANRTVRLADGYQDAESRIVQRCTAEKTADKGVR